VEAGRKREEGLDRIVEDLEVGIRVVPGLDVRRAGGGGCDELVDSVVVETPAATKTPRPPNTFLESIRSPIVPSGFYAFDAALAVFRAFFLMNCSTRS
jgi:hypothetical protein